MLLDMQSPSIAVCREISAPFPSSGGQTKKSIHKKTKIHSQRTIF